MSVEETTEVVPATTRKSTRLICDLCGAKSTDHDSWDKRGDWVFEENTEVTISIDEKSRNPEGGRSDAIHYDCCPACFKAKVVPALEALGLKPREKGFSW